MAEALRLEVGRDRLATLTFDLPGKKVNVFTRGVMTELAACVEALAGRDDVGCLVLLSGKASGFIAGADVEEIAAVTDPEAAAEGVRAGQRLFAAWEALPFPTVAAIAGTCLGGGTELALASTYRVGADGDGVRIGLPEVRLGILPAWGGSTRLPRLIGIAAALDVILAGKTLAARKAFKVGLLDALLPAASFLREVRDFALAHRDQPRRRGGGFDLKELLLEKNPLGRKVLFDQARKRTLAATGGHYPAPLRAIEVVRVGIEEGRQAGFAAEARAAADLATSPVAKNLIHLFWLTEGVKKPERRPAGERREIRQAAVLGAGVMGGGIAQLIAEKTGLPVRLKDVQEAALASGMGHAAALFRQRVERRRLSKVEARRRMALIRPTLDYSGFAAADLVIEAVVERLDLKQKVFAEVAGHAAAAAVLATNTSSLSVDSIGAETPARERVVGMHFFNPVDRMPLVEVIAGEHTGAAAAAAVYDFALALGKTPVVVKDGPGFLVNRLLMFYSAEALWLLDEGHSIADVDRAMAEWGMPMGPLALTDEVGIDVAFKVAHILGEAFGDRLPLPPWLDRLPGDGRRGKKNGAGFYRYSAGRRGEPDPEVYSLLGLAPRVADPDALELADRMVLPMVNEAARCLAEGVVASAGDLDLALVMGTGFPPFRGGLCRWADGQGLAQVGGILERFAATVGERYRPSEAFGEALAAGGFYAWKG
jgi:3-hydroxyacyl-CoA dehydrogenase / enoyl-CoA hydratase / 3-hydroxybutyryl-CoA epimerase